MARLEIRLLGPFEVTLDGGPVTSFETESARALLAYLASEPGRSRARPVVAEMLWPERPEGAALSNLRHVLSVLRRALGDHKAAHPVLVADRNSVSIDASEEVWIDLVEFERLATTPGDDPGATEAWQRAVELWRGPLLEGLRVRAGAEWEEWVVVASEQVRRQFASVLHRLADHYERAGTWDRAISITRRLVDVDPWEERAHRQLMRLLARTGESARALSHFATLEDRLLGDLGATTAPETVALAAQIRAGDLANVASEVEIAYPGFLTRDPAAAPLFVGREEELARLRAQLDLALTGRGRAVFVVGEAGSGKTMLAGEFLRQATDVPHLLAVRGRCNAFGGVGDPYLPFREMLGLLCGNVEADYASGALDREQATRLWEAIPHSARLVSELGSSLVGVMVNGGLLVDRAEQALPGVEWVHDLRSRVEDLAGRPPAPQPVQPALFDEYTAVLERLSVTRPLVLVVDDLQWADPGSIALLWHLARRIAGMRILIVGIYRPEEVTAASGAAPSLADVLGDLQGRTPGCVLELVNDRAFVDDFLDSEPNALGAGFRDRLFSYTGGHPLFTVELMRGMQERAEIHRDRDGVWQARQSLDWDRLPSRVDAVIAQRIARLPDDLRRDLVVASVQGEEFVAEVVRDVRSDGESPARLGRESGSPHRLIAPAGVARIDGELVARHRFRHVLFQRYLYGQLDQAERIRLHEATGRALESLYGDHSTLPLVDLARHFDEAVLVDPAIDYLHRAGRRAFEMSASEEAIRLLERAVDLLSSLPESAERDERELGLLASLVAPVMALRGYAAPEAEAIGGRTLELCSRLDSSPTTAMALTQVATVLGLRADYRDAKAVSRQALAIAETLEVPALMVPALQVVGYNQTWLGELADGHEALQKAHRLYDPVGHSWITHAAGSAPGPAALVWDAVNTLFRGYPDRAFELAERGIGLARELGHAFTLCHALSVGGSIVRMMCGDYGAALPFVNEFGAIAEEERFAFWSIGAHIHRGTVAGHCGDPEAGIAAVTSGLETWRDAGIQAFRGNFLAEIAEFERQRGFPDRGLALVEGVLGEVRTHGERLVEVLVLLQRGKLLEALGDDEGSVRAFGDALEAADEIGARLELLQAATELARVRLTNGDRDNAEKMLAPVYSWFTEGLDTPHLVAARGVLDQI